MSAKLTKFHMIQKYIVYFRDVVREPYGNVSEQRSARREASSKVKIFILQQAKIFSQPLPMYLFATGAGELGPVELMLIFPL